MKLGVCYYPEQWPEDTWEMDAERMKALGISVVRVGEFAWSRLEPGRNQFNFDWLSRALDILHSHDLQVVMGTPTATPPKWLIDEHPSILAVDANGNTKGFGSRRHYCFSSSVYREECQRIVTKVAEAFGDHASLIAWQTDNEYGCHSTIASFSDDAKHAFREWCRTRYGDIQALNTAWGNVFWSMEYSDFDEVDLPKGAVTELNPAHRLAFWRFSSDQVASFNRLQTAILRKYSPQCDLLHNYMGNFTEFDHYTTAADLDIATWDNYPLGFLDRDSSSDQDKRNWYRTGHPDSSTFHHDLYRGVGRGRFWVIEQQPGPVNWAPHNPSPLPGMVRLWGLEALAHDAEVMSWFRWRQMPSAQEQMHTGLLRPDSTEDVAVGEIKQLTQDIDIIYRHRTGKARRVASVAMVFDYSGDHMCRIQPQGNNFEPLQWVMSLYTALRQSGVNIDIVPAGTDLTAYSFVVVANSISVDQSLIDSLQNTDATILIGPRCGSKNDEFSIPHQLAPGPLQALIPIRVIRTESLPDFVQLPSSQHQLVAHRWREEIASEIAPSSYFDDGWGFDYTIGRFHYLNCCLDQASLRIYLRQKLRAAGIQVIDCDNGLRLSHYDDLVFAFNYGPESASLPQNRRYLIGHSTLAAGDVAVFHRD